jgi:hypothetical protein
VAGERPGVVCALKRAASLPDEPPVSVRTIPACQLSAAHPSRVMMGTSAGPQAQYSRLDKVLVCNQSGLQKAELSTRRVRIACLRPALLSSRGISSRNAAPAFFDARTRLVETKVTPQACPCTL